MFDIILNSFGYVKGGIVGSGPFSGSRRVFVGRLRSGNHQRSGSSDASVTTIFHYPCAVLQGGYRVFLRSLHYTVRGPTGSLHSEIF